MLFNMKRICALLLALALLCSILPGGTVWAAEETELTAADYAEVDLVFDLIDKAESAPATRSVTQEQKTQAAMEVVMASESYVDGSLEQSGSSFTWWTESGIRCVYSPRMRKIQSKLKEIGEDAIVNEPTATRGGTPSSNQVYVVGPYYGYDSNFTDQYKNEAQRVADAIGDTDGYTLYSGEAATIDKVAQAVSNGAVVFFDSHGTTDYENPYDELDFITGATCSYMCLTSTAGLTIEDYEDGAAYDSEGAFINGATIANHMMGDSPNGILWMAICLGMGTDGMYKPLRNKGVEVVYGYSQSVTFEGDYRYEETFWGELTAGKTVAQAVAAMKNKWGNWDWSTQIADDYGSYDGYATIEEAREDFCAFPVVVSDEDAWPGQRTGSSYGADSLQTVKSTYTIVEINENTDPTDPTESTDPSDPTEPDQDENNVCWDLTEGVLTISGSGAMEDYFYSSPAPWCDDRDTIKTVVIQDGVTSIGDCAFNAFHSLTSITIADSVTAIGDYAFEGCSSLTSIEIPDSVTTIGYAAFHLCDSLTEIVVDADNTAYSSDRYGVLFNKDKTELICCPGGKTGVYTIPNGVASIGYCAFSWCSKLTGIIFSESVTTMDKWAFADCSNLTEITLPNSVIYIGYYAFAGCSSLKSIVIPNSGTDIGGYAFDGCVSLTDVYYGGTAAKWTALDNRPDVPYVHFECKSSENHWVSETVPGACDTAGYTYKYCPCGYESNKETTFAPGHTEVMIPAIDPTCTETGLTEGKHCSACDVVLVAQTVVDALGHDYETVVVDPTFAKPGYTDHICIRCGDSYQDTATDPIGLPTPEVEAENDSITGKPVLTWEAVVSADYYEIYRSTSKSKNYKYIGMTEGTEYKDDTASSGKTYYYKVQAICKIDEALDSDKSAYVSAKCRYPQAEITEVTTNSSGYPQVKWSKIKGAKKYQVYYSTEENGEYKKLTTTSSTSYTYSKAKRDTEYFFKVRAYGSSSSYAGEFSEVVSGYRTLARPSISLSTSQSKRTVTIKWKSVSKAIGYELQCSVNGGEFVTIAEGNILKFVHTDLAPGNEYTYRLRALSGKEETTSRYSSTKSSTIKVGKPVVSITLAENGKPQLTWEAVDGAVEYQVYYATSKKGSYKRVETTEELSFIYEAAKSGKTYYFKVRAVDVNGTKGDYSSYVKIKAK